MGDLDRAIPALLEALALDSSRAAWWSDLAAIRLTRAEHDGLALELPQALEASGRALALTPSLLEAQFNHALALTQLGLRRSAADAWSRYLKHETDPSWRAEAEARRSGLESVHAPDAQHARERLFDQLLPAWADAGESERERHARAISHSIHESGLLRQEAAAGYRHYGAARRHYANRQFLLARREFEAALNVLPYVNPVAGWASYYIAVIDYLEQRTTAALGRLAKRWGGRAVWDQALEGHVRWLRAMVFVLEGRHREAVAEYRAAARSLQGAGESANAAFVDGLLAEEMDWLGDPEGAWEHRLLALRMAPRPGTLLSTAGIARMNGWIYLAQAIQTEAAGASAANPEERTDSLRDLALTLAESGEYAKACRTILEAERVLRSAHEASARQLAELDAARVAGRCGGPDVALAAAERAVEFFSKFARIRLPDIYAGRSAIHRTAGRPRQAAADLEAALAGLEEEARHAPRLSIQASLGEPVRRLTNELVSLQLDAGQSIDALAAADRSRSLELRPHTPPLTAGDVEALARRLGQDVTLLYFQQEPQRLLRWHLSRDGVRANAISISAGDLARKVDAFARNPSNRRLATEMRDLLFEGAPSERVVIVPDGALHLLPVAMTAGWSRAFAIEETTLSIAPSLSWIAGRGRPKSAVLHATIIANPTIDRSVFRRLPDLPAAVVEGRRIAEVYEQSSTLEGPNATSAAVVRALLTSQVVHFAGHALLNELNPSRSQLVVSDAASRPLTAQRLSGLDLRHSLIVVLAACEAASGRVTKAEGPLGLARALISAGTQSVVGSLWPVDDVASAALFPDFHARYRVSGDAASALRASQLSMLRSQSPDLAAPRAWGGFLVVHAPPLTF